MEPEPLITITQMATRLTVSPEMVRAMCRTQKWPHVKVGRLYRFTEEQYQQIITPSPASPPPARTQRQRIGRMLESLPESRIETVMGGRSHGS